MTTDNHWVYITPQNAVVDGKQLFSNPLQSSTSILTELYHNHIGDYPKFHKMDPLCKLGFVSSELLLDAEGKRNKAWGDQRGVILFNASSSLADDLNYQDTINDPANPFPSPSLFVYTLPNVVTGEIAIRNKFYGESNFIVLPTPDAAAMANIIYSAFHDTALQSLLTGWIDCFNEKCFCSLLWLVQRNSIQNRDDIFDNTRSLLTIVEQDRQQ